ncbi:hypothetical protein D3C76_1659590 [compost metagenome]
MGRARLRTLTAPEEAFQVKSANKESWPRIAMQLEVHLKPEKFAEWLSRYRALLKELDGMNAPGDEESRLFYLASVGFQAEEPLFVDEEEDDGSSTTT